MLATPIAQAMARSGGGVGIGLAELTSVEHTVEDLVREDAQREWLSRVLSWGLPVAFDRLRWYSVGGLAYLKGIASGEGYLGALTYADMEGFGEEIDAWGRSCSAVGYTWPVGGPSPTAGFLESWEDLVQLVGLHWYHFWSWWSESHGGWHEHSNLSLVREETRMGDDLEAFLDVTSGRVSRWWISEIGFPAVSPWLGTQKQNERDTARWNPEASELLQASILVRRVLYLRSLPNPPLMVAWWTMFDGIVGEDLDSGWQQFSAMGIRNDCALPGSSSGGVVAQYSQAGDAWPRAAWHTMRRIAWLLARVRSAEILFEDAMNLAVVLRLKGPFHDPGTYAQKRYSQMIVAWIDHNTTASTMRVSVGYTGKESERISLVPEVSAVPLKSPPPLDGNGYPIGGNVNWTWTGWDPGKLTFVGRRATWTLSDPRTISAPFCLLLDPDDSVEPKFEIT